MLQLHLWEPRLNQQGFVRADQWQGFQCHKETKLSRRKGQPGPSRGGVLITNTPQSPEESHLFTESEIHPSTLKTKHTI